MIVLKFNELSEIDRGFLNDVLFYKNLSLAIDKKVGAVLGNHLIGDLLHKFGGFNHMFEDINNGVCENEKGKSFPWVIHAEESVIQQAIQYYSKIEDIENYTMYCNYAPCVNCCKQIVLFGIRRIMFLEKHKTNFDNCEFSSMEFLKQIEDMEIIQVIN